MNDIARRQQRNAALRYVVAAGVDMPAITALRRDTGADTDDVIAEIWIQLQAPACARAASRAAWAVAAARAVLRREHAPTAPISLDDDEAGLHETLAAKMPDEPTPLPRAELVRELAVRLGVGVRRAQQRVKSLASAPAAGQGDLFGGRANG